MLKHFKENLNGTTTYPSTCQEYFDRGTRTNGTFKIRPNLALNSYHVECIFSETEGMAILNNES